MTLPDKGHTVCMIRRRRITVEYGIVRDIVFSVFLPVVIANANVNVNVNEANLPRSNERNMNGCTCFVRPLVRGVLLLSARLSF